MKMMKTRRIQHTGHARPVWPSLLLGFLLTLFLVSFLYAGYLFLVWGRAVAATVPELPELSLPKLVRSIPAQPRQAGGVASVLFQPIGEPAKQAAPALSGRVTILLMGVDNRPDEPVARTDSIMVVTLNPQTGTAGMLSLPRDMFVHVAALNRDVKINTVHVLGEINKVPGGGPGLLRETVSDLIGYPVDYYVRINFDGFEQIIDLIGGVDIDVAKEIRDDKYPDNNYGYEPLYIPAGRQHMDGELALKYSRTRHTDSDYGRARRQQQVMVAIKEKILRPGEMAALLPRLPGLAIALANSVQTDMPVDRAIALARNLDQVNLQNPTQVVVDNNMGQEKSDPALGFILVVDRNKLHAAANALFADAPQAAGGGATPAAPTPQPQLARARIVVLNGSPESGAAARAAADLGEAGFNIIGVGNADRADYEQSWLISYGDELPDAREALVRRFGITPEHVRSEPPSADTDLTLILGADQAQSTAQR